MRVNQPNQPATAFKALLVSLLGGVAYGASSSLLPLVKINLIVLLGAAVISGTTHLLLQRGLLANLAVSLISAALAVVAMWMVWFALEYSPQQLLSVLSQGPKGITSTLQRLAATTSVSVRLTGGTTTTHGPAEMRLFWILETAALAAGPVLGALFSPMKKRRLAAA